MVQQDRLPGVEADESKGRLVCAPPPGNRPQETSQEPPNGTSRARLSKRQGAARPSALQGREEREQAISPNIHAVASRQQVGQQRQKQDVAQGG